MRMGDDRILNDDLLDKIQIEITTKEEVVSILGTPQIAHSMHENGVFVERLMYTYAKADSDVWSYIPILWFFGKTHMESYMVTITVNASGVVLSIDHAKNTGEYGNM